MIIAATIVVPIRDDPPAETNGKGTPVIGNNPIFIPTWIKVCIKRIKKAPEVKARAVGLTESPII